MGLPDVVYLCGPKVGEELRWSLRSLTNLPHGKVWLAGFVPKWVRNVGQIPVKQRPAEKWENQVRNLRAACEHPDVSGQFVMFNDDFFVMEPAVVTARHRGLLAEFAGSKQSKSRWHLRLRDTAAMLGPEALAYDGVHVPMLFDKTLMLEVLDDIGETGLFRSVYGNRHKIGGVEGPDAKVRDNRTHGEGPFWSTSDRSFRYKPIGRTVRQAFPERCGYERS